MIKIKEWTQHEMRGGCRKVINPRDQQNAWRRAASHGQVCSSEHVLIVSTTKPCDPEMEEFAFSYQSSFMI